MSKAPVFAHLFLKEHGIVQAIDEACYDPQNVSPYPDMTKELASSLFGPYAVKCATGVAVLSEKDFDKLLDMFKVMPHGRDCHAIERADLAARFFYTFGTTTVF